MTNADIQSWMAREPFDTLDECLEHVAREHPQHPPDRTSTGSASQCPPRWLFRSEAGWGRSSVSLLRQVRDGEFAGIDYDDVLPIFEDLDPKVQRRLSVDPLLSAGLLQHYGMVTDLVGASALLEVAAACFRQQSDPRQPGAIAVFDMEKLCRNAVVVDLATCPRAVRPQRCQCYALLHHEHRDFKSPAAQEELGIAWYAFRRDPRSPSPRAIDGHMLSALDDEVAGVLRLWLDGTIESLGKVPDPLARFLAQRFAHCPMATEVESWWRPDDPKTVRMVPAALAGLPVDLTREVEETIQVWSQDFPLVAARTLPQTASRPPHQEG